MISNRWNPVPRIIFFILTLGLFTTTLLADEAGAKDSFGFWDVMLMPRVWVGFIFVLAGLWFLNRRMVTKNFRLISLVIIFLTFGVFWLLPLGEFASGMGLHPSPVCAVTKPGLFIKAGRGFPVVFRSRTGNDGCYESDWKKTVLRLGLPRGCRSRIGT